MMKNIFSLVISMTMLLIVIPCSGQNLIDSSDWVSGTNGATANFGLQGVASQNSRVSMIGPMGNQVTVWKMLADGSSGFNGGFSHNGVTLDTSKSYRVSFWVYSNGPNNCSNYMGFTPYNTSGALIQPFQREDGQSFDWPYFSSINHPNGKWTLVVGYFRPSSATDQNESGIYDPSAGSSSNLPSPSYPARDYIFPSGQSQINIRVRAFMWGCGAGEELFVYDPRIEESTSRTPMSTLLYGNTGADQSPPTPPSLTSTAKTPTTVNLSWSGANDNIGVTGYKVYQNNTPIITLGAQSSYQVSGLSQNTTYAFRVLALDAAGNESSLSNLVNVTTENGSSPSNSSKINLIGLSAEQSSNNYSSSSLASVAIDGNTSGDGQNFVTHTANEEDAWWRIDLGNEYDLTRIDIFNRTNCCNSRLAGTKVYVGSTNSYNPSNYQQVGGTLTSSTTVQRLDFVARGRYILVSQHDKTGASILSIAELEAYGSLVSNGGGVNPPPTSSSVWSESNSTASYAGQVAIGRTTVPSGYKLGIDGKVRAREIRVDQDNWPDYVFKEDYHLPTLAEIQKHIKEKGHLPNIPSAKEVEASGIELGEMNKLLLEKIEQLTLYIIKQQVELDSLKEEVGKSKE